TASTTAAAPHRAPWWRRRVGAVAAAAALLVVAPLAWLAARDAGGVPRGVNPRKSYLVAPFDVMNDPSAAWLREGSVSMLSLSLSQWRDLQVVDYERTLDLLRDAKLDGDRGIGLEAARAMARRAGVWTVVMGQVSRLGDSLVVSARMFDVASGRRVDGAQRAVVAGADPRPMYDALARDLLDLAGAPPTVALGRLTETTTQSVDAYRAYLDGVRALNAWQLDRADSSLARAVAADSSFALAYYKRAVGMGWRQAGDSAQRATIARAVALSGRLPARERQLVVAYADLVAALADDQRADTLRGNALFRSAQKKYEAAVALDSADAEAWYGLGDAYWHYRPDGWGGPATVAGWSRALAAFNRTLALDSTFYLAYAHKIDIYRQAGGQVTGLVLERDTLRLLDSAARRAYGPARIAAAQHDAMRLAMRAGRAWVDADPAPHAYESLAYLFAGDGEPDSAIAVLREAQRRPESRSAKVPFTIAALETRADPPAALGALRTALRDADPAALRAQGGADLFEVLVGAGNAAAVAGSVREVDDVVRLVELVTPPPSAGEASRGMQARWWALGSKVAMGVPFERLRPTLDSGIAYVERVTGPFRSYARQQSVSVPYVAYLVTRDPRYLAPIRRWRADSGRALVELDALEALDRGDTATARRLVRQFPSVDSARAAGAAQSIPRWVARAEVLESLGDARGAAAVYEALDPARFSSTGPTDPAWPLYTRSFLARGRLYERLGDRPRAAAAYDRFLRITAEANGAFDAERREAKAALARVQDAAGTAVPVR
ncbi:MAG TPA: hypothetical protein VFJ74_15190, partial [Gemmatimonadaceae bacterium]|nr:hypothetical protein [Gemmatimonadaceae bacterium]